MADADLILKITYPDDLKKVKEHFENAFKEFKSQDINLDFRIITPDEKLHWIEHSCTAVYDENGQWLGRRESNRDITERKLAEIKLRHLKEELQAANHDLKSALMREQQLARTDVLTGVNNRRHLYKIADHEFEVAARYQQPISVIMLDIDHFKKINDTFGHAVGDQILQRVTQTACTELRSADMIGRYGGEEFLIVLPMTNAQQAYLLAERLRVDVEALSIPTPKGDACVTLSIGVVEMWHVLPAESVESVFRRADEAMYTAKQAGRNRTEIGE
jgi:diguanylate cyclase (GGDEF)-like protein